MSEIPRLGPRAALRRRNRRLRWTLIACVTVASAYAARGWWLDRHWVSTDDAFVAGHVVGVEAQTAGTVVEILAEDTQAVAAGQLLVRLDGRHAEIGLRQAEAELADAVRRIAALAAKRDTLRQRLAVRGAALAAVRHDLNRMRLAIDEGAVSEQQVQNAEDKIRELEAAEFEVGAEQAELAAQLGTTDIAEHPAVELAKQRLRRAYLEYRRREVRAPVAGVVAKRKARVGDSVQPGIALLTIVAVDRLWVEANVPENRIAGIRPGLQAEIRVDAYPDRLYHGRVEGLLPGTGSVFALLPTDNATGNFIHVAERVPVRVVLNNEELAERPLQPGLSTLTRIELVADDRQTPRQSLVDTTAVEYRTMIYDDELAGVEEAIASIVAANRR